MASSKDRPAGMDSLSMNRPKRNQPTPKMPNEMGTVAKVAAGPVNADKVTSAATRKMSLPKD